MANRTIEQTDYAAYIAECPASPAERAIETAARQARMARFPFAVMLTAFYPEMDFADRWCWTQFGPRDGPCQQNHSEYCCCTEPMPHGHSGSWTSHWFEKTDYDFGFNEWYFDSSSQQERFLANLGNINFGENYDE